jgi:serine/threonine protein kinase
MARIPPDYETLAQPPDLTTCTRDVYPPSVHLSAAQALSVAQGVAAAAVHLHAHGILHGDLYSHNVLWNAQGGCLLGDFGAASFYSADDSRNAHRLERIEVLAFGHLLGELIQHAKPASWSGKLQNLHVRCTQGDVLGRPGFQEVVLELAGIEV